VIKNFKIPGSSLSNFDDKMKVIQKGGYDPEGYVNQRINAR